MAPVIVRQRNQVTIPKAIADAAGITEGTVVDFVYADGVITITLGGHDGAAVDVMRWAGIGEGTWGSSAAEVDAYVRDLRDDETT